jgi:hypothetical protein
MKSNPYNEDFEPRVTPVAIGLESKPVAPAAPPPTTQTTSPPPPSPPAAHKRARTANDLKRKPPVAAKKPEPERVYPWEDANPKVPKVFNLRFTEVQYRMLWFLSETTMGETMHSIAMRGVQNEVARMMRERGIKPPKWD